MKKPPFRPVVAVVLAAAVLLLLLLVTGGHPFAPAASGTGSPVAYSTSPEQTPLASPDGTPRAAPASPRSAAPLPSPTRDTTLALLAKVVPPERDLFDLARRLRPGAGATTPTPALYPPELTVGHREVFWLADMTNNTRFTAAATLRLRTEHAYFYIAEGIEVAQADLEKAGRDFEERVFPKVTGYFGDRWGPDSLSGDARLTIIVARTPGVGGYFSSSDEYPKAVNPYSNERSIIYVNGASARPGTDSFAALLAHEFQHALHWRIDGHEQTWISEGNAELAAELSGYSASSLSAFLEEPNTQLNTWSESRDEARKHYGASYLFMKYLIQHYGGYGALKDFLATPGHGERKVDTYLALTGYGVDFNQVFADFAVANLLDLPDGGVFSYPDARVQVRPVEKVTALGKHKIDVDQYGSRYLELNPGTPSFRLQYAGSSQVSLIGNEAHSGRYEWWSNKADNMDSTLTRSFDLGGVKTATLRFWTWYEIEKTWDDAYLEVSVDGGTTWTILRGPRSSTDDPLGNSYGPAYTGTSGDGRQPIWVEESVDLTPYAGKQILLRFEYVTDESTSLQGLALDDISIPEIGFADDAEADQGWQANGFLRTDNILPQRFVARLVRIGRQVTVEDLPLDSQQAGEVEVRGLGQTVDRVVLVVAGLAPITVQPASFELTISPN